MWRIDRWSWLAVGVIFLTGVILLAMGRVPYCECGYISIWHSDINNYNSQHLSDWYMFSHVIHGALFFYFFRWLFPRWSVGKWLLAAVLVEAGWEILENTPMVINHYRDSTMSLNYYGDSVINSLSDILAMMLGFWMALKWKWWVVLSLIVVMELVVGYLIRDNLFFNVLMVVWPVEAVRDWQMQGGPMGL